MTRYAEDFDRGGRYRSEGESGYSTDYGRARPRAGRPGQRSHRRVYGFPVRGYRTYDLDYGSTGGPTTDYSGRAGYPVLRPRTGEDTGLPHRGPYTPTLEEEDRGRTLYGGVPPEYPDRARGAPPRRRRRRGAY